MMTKFRQSQRILWLLQRHCSLLASDFDRSKSFHWRYCLYRRLAAKTRTVLEVLMQTLWILDRPKRIHKQLDELTSKVQRALLQFTTTTYCYLFGTDI